MPISMMRCIYFNIALSVDGFKLPVCSCTLSACAFVQNLGILFEEPFSSNSGNDDYHILYLAQNSLGTSHGVLKQNQQFFLAPCSPSCETSIFVKRIHSHQRALRQ